MELLYNSFLHNTCKESILWLRDLELQVESNSIIKEPFAKGLSPIHQTFISPPPTMNPYQNGEKHTETPHTWNNPPQTPGLPKQPQEPYHTLL
ncbi:hypothetical protein TMatcc_006031 [Talaromyces marneffei ATCC 18224]